MASSGTISSSVFGGGFYIDIKWATQSQSTSSNSSSVKVDVVFRAASGYSTSTSATKNGSVTINGTVHNFTFTAGLSSGGSKTVKSVTQTIPHNSDGSKTASVSTTLGLNLTLSGSYIGDKSVSGSMVLNKINLTTSPGTGSMTSPSKSTVSEKTTSISVKWSGFTNGTNNTINKYEVQYAKNGGSWTGLATVTTTATSGSYTHTITAAEGQTYKYRVRGCGSSGTWTGYTAESGTVTTNTFTAGNFTGHSNDLDFSKTSFTLYFSGGKNTDGTGVKYLCYSDNVTVYNQVETTGTSQTISIWKSGSYPSGPYMKFDDLKNYFKNSSYNGRLHVGLRTNNTRSNKYAGGSIGVDLRVAPVAPSEVKISDTVSSTTALRKHNGLNANYYVPDNTRTVSFSWTAGSAPLGDSFYYRLYAIVGGTATIIKDNLTSTATSYTYTPSRLSSGTKTLAFGVHVVTSYGYSSYRDSGNVTMHSYSSPTITTSVSERTPTGAKVKYKVTTNSSLTTAATGSWTCSGATPPSGTISSTTEQTITFTGLSASSGYTVNFTYNDNSGWSTNGTKSQSISEQLPIMSISPLGVGIGGGTPTSSVKLDVIGGEIKSTHGLVATNPLASGTASLSLNFNSGSVARLRYGGNGAGATNGFNIEGPGDNVKMRIDDSGNLTTTGYLKSSTSTIQASSPVSVLNGSAAQSIRVGTLLASDAYADASKVPANGIYAKGELHAGGHIKSGANMRIGTGGSDVFINNLAANTYLQILNSGGVNGLQFGGSKVWTDANTLAPASGAWWRGVPRVSSDGVLEIGKYIDFHDSNTTTADYTCRIQGAGDYLYTDGAFLSRKNQYNFTARQLATGNAMGVYLQSPDATTKVQFYTPNSNYNAHVYSNAGAIILRGTYVGCRNNGDTGYVESRASKFTVNSELKWKTNVQELEYSALDKINNSTIYSYDKIVGDATEKEIGLVIEYQAPEEVIVEREKVDDRTEEEKSATPALLNEINDVETEKFVDLYAMASLAWKAIQELSKENARLRRDIDFMEQALVETGMFKIDEVILD